MHQVNPPVPSIDLEQLKLSWKAADDEKAACHGLVDLHDASDVILTVLKTNITLILIPIEVQGAHVNARQILIYNSLPTIQGLPHGDVPLGMASDDEVVHLTETENRMIFINIWYVWIIQCVLNRRKEVILLSWRRATFCWSIRYSGLLWTLLIYHWSIAAFFAIVILHAIAARHDDVFVLIDQLLCTV